MVPQPAFREMTDRDGYWGAKIVASFSDAQIVAAVEAAHYEDPRARDFLVRNLIVRRDKIARHWFGRVAPLDFFSVVDSTLNFHDLAVDRGLEEARTYVVKVEQVGGSGGGDERVHLDATELSLATLGKGASRLLLDDLGGWKPGAPGARRTDAKGCRMDRDSSAARMTTQTPDNVPPWAASRRPCLVSPRRRPRACSPVAPTSGACKTWGTPCPRWRPTAPSAVRPHVTVNTRRCTHCSETRSSGLRPGTADSSLRFLGRLRDGYTADTLNIILCRRQPPGLSPVTPQAAARDDQAGRLAESDQDRAWCR